MKKESYLLKIACLITVIFATGLTCTAQGLPNKTFGAIYQEDIHWAAFPAFPPQARIAILVGDPKLNQPYVIRVKVPGGVKLMPHIHPEDRIYTVISGVFYIGLGKTFDAS